MPDDNKKPNEPDKPQRDWRELVLEHLELSGSNDHDAVARRREIQEELLKGHARYRCEYPQSFGRSGRGRDDEFDR
jgi:hypothetical protein